MLKQFTGSISDPEFIKTLQRKGQTHVVCIAVNGLTLFNGLAVEAFEKEHRSYVSFEEGTRLCVDSNENNVVRTLFPKMNISVLPLSIYEERNSWEDKIFIKKNIINIFEFDDKFLRSRRFIFALEERTDFNKSLFLATLAEVLNDEKWKGKSVFNL